MIAKMVCIKFVEFDNIKCVVLCYTPTLDIYYYKCDDLSPYQIGKSYDVQIEPNGKRWKIISAK